MTYRKLLVGRNHRTGEWVSGIIGVRDLEWNQSEWRHILGFAGWCRRFGWKALARADDRIQTEPALCSMSASPLGSVADVRNAYALRECNIADRLKIARAEVAAD